MIFVGSEPCAAISFLRLSRLGYFEIDDFVTEMIEKVYSQNLEVAASFAMGWVKL